MASIAEATAAPAAATASGTEASSAFMSSTSSAVERRSRSAASGFHASVASSSSFAVARAPGRGLLTIVSLCTNGLVVKTTSGKRSPARGAQRAQGLDGGDLCVFSPKLALLIFAVKFWNLAQNSSVWARSYSFRSFLFMF